MRIQELEQRIGIERASIRFYEKEGLLAPRRNENGYRDYSEENAQELKKIRLLRQLGLSIGTIRSLQKGSGELDRILSEQIASLTGQIEEQKRAKLLCQTMKNDNATYENLNVEHYLELLNDLQTQDQAPTGQFQESLPEQIHPWRRFLARMLDYAWFDAVIHFLIVVVFRVRPLPNGFLHVAITVMSGALFIPLEALMLSTWATTPGKYIFGIRIEAEEGGRLGFFKALLRAKSVYTNGLFFRIPIVQDLGMLWQYCRLTGRFLWRSTRYSQVSGSEQMRWDSESELSYRCWDWKRGVALVTAAAVVLLLLTVTTLDGIRPKYRGSLLTIEQFAQNYNYYLELLNEDVPTYDTLRPDGSKHPVPSDQAVVVTPDGPYEPLEFQYTEENGYLRAVTIEKEWQTAFPVTPIGLAIHPLLTIVMAQDSLWIGDIVELFKQLDARLNKPEGCFTFHDLIRVEWSIQTDNCTTHNGVTYYPSNQTGNLSFWFQITVLS